MSKKSYIFYTTFTIFLSFIQTFTSKLSENGIKNNDIENGETRNNNESLKETDSSFENQEPFKNFNFSNVIHFDDSNYTKEMQKYELLYLLFYTPWCTNCVKLMSIYIETANYCKKNNLSAKFAKIDGSVSENATIDFNVQGFPSIYLIYDGERIRFNGIRTKEGLLNFIKRKMNEDIYKINRLEELKDISNIYNTSLILLSTIKDRNTMIYKSFENLAKQLMYIDFVSCISDECYEKYGEDIILFKDFDEKENRYSANYSNLDDAKNDSVKNFISIYGVEAGAFIDQHHINLMFEYDKKGIFYIRNSSMFEHTYYDSFIKRLGKKLRAYDIYVFISSPDGNDLQRSVMKAFSISLDELPGIFYYDPNTGDPVTKIKLYSMRHLDMEKINFNSIKKFITDIKTGKIKRDLYSENLSESKIINGMKYVIGKTYDQDVINEKKNVFLGMIEGNENDIENNFLNIFGNLTKKYQSDTEKNIKFNIMDINKNEPRDIDVNSFDFPRAYLFTNAMEKKETIRYMPKNLSDLKVEEFEAFLNEKLGWEKNEYSDDDYQEEAMKEKNKIEDKKNGNEDL